MGGLLSLMALGGCVSYYLRVVIKRGVLAGATIEMEPLILQHPGSQQYNGRRAQDYGGLRREEMEGGS